MSLAEIKAELKKLADKKIAEHSQRFFKTGPGEYGEGDVFIGIRVPVLRKLAKEYRDVDLKTVRSLLRSPIHEQRLFALLILVLKYPKAAPAEQKKIYDLYLASTRYINNWDLVDTSAEHIVGAHLRDRSRKPLLDLARSADLWERRIAILATFHFIRRDEFEPTLSIAKMLLDDEEDLIHKAVGWLLREVGKRDRSVEEEFLRKHYKKMPRTMLRYAIERFPERLRKAYLAGRV